MSDARFAERRHDLQRQRWKRIGIGVLLLVVVVTLAWVIWFSRVLAVRTVAVNGETTLTESQVRAQAEIRTGEPLARVDIASIEARVAAMERVQEVSVKRSWPHTITIEIVERKAVAWLSAGGQTRGLDRFGVDFRSYDKAPKGLLEARVSVTDARKRQQTLVAVAGVASLIESKDPALRKQVQVISAASKDSIELNLTKGRTVTWGSEADSTRKLGVLKALLKIKAVTYDVSAPDQPTTKK